MPTTSDAQTAVTRREGRHSATPASLGCAGPVERVDTVQDPVQAEVDPSSAYSSPAALGAIADHQPITPIIETVRGLLVGTPVGSSGWLAVAWCGGLLVVSCAAASALFRRRTAR